MIVWRVVGLLACDSSGFLRLPACIELLQQRQQQQALTLHCFQPCLISECVRVERGVAATGRPTDACSLAACVYHLTLAEASR